MKDTPESNRSEHIRVGSVTGFGYLYGVSLNPVGNVSRDVRPWDGV